MLARPEVLPLHRHFSLRLFAGGATSTSSALSGSGANFIMKENLAMATPAQIAANRRKAQKSTGPKTPEGKQTVSQNAVRHGLLSTNVLLPGEDPEAYPRVRATMMKPNRRSGGSRANRARCATTRRSRPHPQRRQQLRRPHSVAAGVARATPTTVGRATPARRNLAAATARRE